MDLRTGLPRGLKEIASVGDDGLSVLLISPFGKTPFQSLVEHVVGTEQLIFDLMYYPERSRHSLQ